MDKYVQLAQMAISKGLIKKLTQTTFGLINLSLNPYESTRQFYDNLTLIVKAWQKLTFLAQKDSKFLEQFLDQMNQVDPWMNFMSRIYKGTIRKQKKNMLVYQRFDFMSDVMQVPKIIQYNFMSVGASVYSQIIHECHKLFYPQHSQQILQNNACDEFMNTISQHYQKRKLKGVLLIPIGAPQWRTFKELQYFYISLIKLGIRVRRVTMKEIYDHSRLDQYNDLYFGEDLVSFILFRHGFKLQHYSQIEFQEAVKLRIMLADSNATCIPNITHEIVNMKLIQCELSKPQVMRKYLSQQEAKLIEMSLVETHSFSAITEQDLQRLLVRIKDSWQEWVLKPNGEGGSNNIFNKNQIVSILLNKNEKERKEFVLQQRINSPFNINYSITTNYELIKTRCNYELGRFGIVSIIEDEESLRYNCGQHVQTRDETHDEGNQTPVGAIDSFCSWKIAKQ